MGQDEFNSLGMDELTDLIKTQVKSAYEEKTTLVGRENFGQLERYIILQIIDQEWVNHLQDMEQMKEGISLRGYGQLDPLREYQKEGFALFEELMDRIREEILTTLFRIRLVEKQPEEPPQKRRKVLHMTHGGDAEQPATVRRKGKKIGRNDPCPCGSGKKYKKCCGA
jgi:preprotein translocase subunit SecA